MPMRSRVVWLTLVLVGFALRAAAADEAPMIVAPPASVVAFKDDTVRLTVVGRGSPAPTYVWLKDEEVLPGQTSATLTLPRIQPIDAGLYSVALVNDAGAVRSVGEAATSRRSVSPRNGR